LKFIFENFRQLCERCYCAIPDLGELNLRVVIFNALVMSLSAMINLSVEDNCGIGELWGGNSKVSTVRSLAVAEM
jgi:hypothetical protein